MNVSVKPGQAIALAFVQALTGESNPTVRLASLYEAPGTEGQAGEISGTIPALWAAVEGAQEAGCAIFIFPNEIEPVEGYANASNVVKYRVHFADFDKGFPVQWHRQPDLIVKTSIKDGVQRGQAYWLIVPSDAVTWRRNQRRLLAHYGDDKSVSDAIRRLRLPGSLHLKGAPQLVHFEDHRDPDAALFGLPTSDGIVTGLPDLPARVAGSTATDDWSWSKHKPETVRLVYATIDPVMREDYGGWIGRIKLLAERGIELTEAVPDEWWLDTALAYCRGDLRRQYLDKNFPTPDTFKGDRTEAEVRAMFEGAGQDDDGSGKYTVHSLYLDAVDAGYRGAFDERPASEVFRGLTPSPDIHTVIPIPPKYRRSARFPGYASRTPQDSKTDDLDWHRALTTKVQPFTEEEVTELLTTHRFDKRRNTAEREYSGRFAFLATGLRRGHTPQSLYDLMVAHGDDRHMAGIKGADDPALALRTEIENVCRSLGDDLDKAVVQIIDGQEAQTVDKIERAIVENNVPLFENDLGVMTPGEFVYKNRRGDDVQTMRLLDVTAAAFTDILNRSVELQRFNKKEKAMLPVDCPQVIAQNFMKRQGRHMLRPIAGITLIPILRQDGSILNEAGYDVDTGMLFEPCGIEFPDVPASPTKEDAAAALKFLLDPLRLVPFETEDARAVMASGLLSLLARRVVDNVPLHAFDATAPGSGKTLAVDSASIIATGEPAQHMSLYPNDEENAKGLAALLRQGAPLISYDNVNMPLGFPQLERALTAERPQDRILGQTQTSVATNNAVMFANGNNFAVKGEMHRRTLIARIDPQDEHPERRHFEFNPLTLYRQDRPRYVLAGLTVLRAHMLAGLPGRRSDMPSGSFDLWSDIVRGALVWLGLGDPIATQARLQDEDTDKGQFGYLLEQWEACGLFETTVADIMKAITSTDMQPAQRALGDVIREIAGLKDGKIDTKALGDYLRKRAGQIVGGRRIEPNGITHGMRRWKLFSVHARRIA